MTAAQKYSLKSRKMYRHPNSFLVAMSRAPTLGGGCCAFQPSPIDPVLRASSPHPGLCPFRLQYNEEIFYDIKRCTKNDVSGPDVDAVCNMYSRDWTESDSRCSTWRKCWQPAMRSLAGHWSLVSTVTIMTRWLAAACCLHHVTASDDDSCFSSSSSHVIVVWLAAIAVRSSVSLINFRDKLAYQTSFLIT